EKEPFSPPAYLSLPAASFSPKRFVLYDVAGSFESWESFGSFYNTLCEGRDRLSAPMEAEVKKLVQNATSDEEKIAILYKFLQKNMRYVSVNLGIGGWQPFDAQYVETNKYGDCKALTNFMKSILKAAGIESYPVLVYAGKEKIDMPDDFFISQFNHAILYVPGPDHWLECTSISHPPNYLGTFTGDRDVLVVTANGGKKMHTPDYSKTLNSITRKAVFKILDTGEAALTDQALYRGEPHDIWRAELVYRSEEEIRKDVMKSLPFSNPVLNKFTIEPDASLPEAWVKMDLILPRYASMVGKRLFVPVNKINNIGEAPAGVENRKNKIFLNAGRTEIDSLVFEIPAGYQLEGGAWTPVHLTSAFGEYSAELAADQKTVTFIRRFKKNNGVFPPETYAELCSFYREILKSDNRKLVFTQKTADNKP
ncbi:MAG TPA: transglutaminase-like domain-containing protein, partial [Saprospiraceae bacterium]|nr:transglutaminase-like domain-containing protein [Saprospiraceae bacterium]